ncbi:restriction endonuclease subunit S [Marivirga tractuosa]|uniref:restriction endonuclease subunit S n=1 Tax=Marivirga tractuosa TaxID=1006 RepID=UPI0035CF96CD
MMREDWIEIELGEILNYVQPTNYIVKDTSYSDNYNTPVLTPGKSFIKGYTKETDGIYDNLPTIIFDDFTTASRYVNFPFKVKSSAMKILEPKTSDINLSYVYYAMQILSVRSDTHKRYWISVYSKKTIPFPSLPEQSAIISKIEQLFSELENGIANLRSAKEKLEIYRQAVLKKAFEGKFKKHLISEITKKVQIGPFGSQLHKAEYITGGIPLINPIHIKNGKICPSDEYSISVEKRNKLPNYILKFNDIIMGRRGEMGRGAMVTKKEEGWFCGTGSLYLRPLPDLIYSPFLFYYIISPVVKEQLSGSAAGTTMMNLNKKIINNLYVPLPSIEEQYQIVQEIETQLSVCDKLAENINESLEKSEALRQSILKKAFSGELLTEKELEACKQEVDWEPAEKLLERIKKSK